MPPRTHYDVLHLDSKNATPDEIKRAFRKLSMEHHPDKNGNSDESKRAFQEINEAYEVLSDPAKRNNYDFEMQMGIGGTNAPRMHMHHMGPMGMGPMGMGMGMGMGPGMGPIDMLFAAMHNAQAQAAHAQAHAQAQHAHMFESIFGSGGMGPKIIIHNFVNGEEQNSPADSTYDTNVVMSISLADAFNGCNQRPVSIQYEDETHTVHTETLMLNIPPGILNGHKVVIPGRGNVVSGGGGRRGTLNLEIQVAEHPQFRREGDVDLRVEHRVSLKEALCGFTFELLHLNGRNYKFNCKPGSITSMTETKVMPGLGFNNGSLKIHFLVDLPTALTQEQIDALSNIL